jgi:hypothetical protein
MKVSALLLSLALLTIVPCAPHAEAAPKAGTYKDFNDVDEVTVVQPFQSASYNRIAVQPIDTRNAPLPDASDNSYKDVKAALAASTASFIEGMRNKIGGMQVGTGSGGAKTLVVRARITKSDPGSQAARYWGGFGAGAAKVGIAGEIVDGGSGKVLVRFSQERRSGFGLFGGGYRDLLDRTMRQIGGDVAGLVRAF